jgi:hypothetical protein
MSVVLGVAMWSRIALLVTALLAFFGLISAPAQAGPIKYVVSQTVCCVYPTVAAGKVTGFIETDGKIGGLAKTDVIGWNLLLSGGGSKADLTPLDSSVSVSGNYLTADGPPLSATSSELLFDFTINFGYSFCFSGFIGSYCWYDGEVGPSGLDVIRPRIVMGFGHFYAVGRPVQVVAAHGAPAALSVAESRAMEKRLLELAEELEAKAVALETPQAVIPRATRP